MVYLVVVFFRWIILLTPQGGGEHWKDDLIFSLLFYDCVIY